MTYQKKIGANTDMRKIFNYVSRPQGATYAEIHNDTGIKRSSISCGIHTLTNFYGYVIATLRVKRPKIKRRYGVNGKRDAKCGAVYIKKIIGKYDDFGKYTAFMTHQELQSIQTENRIQKFNG